MCLHFKFDITMSDADKYINICKPPGGLPVIDTQITSQRLYNTYQFVDSRYTVYLIGE